MEDNLKKAHLIITIWMFANLFLTTIILLIVISNL